MLKSRDIESITILLVEDDDLDAMGVERALKKRHAKLKLVRAKDGVDGLACLHKLQASGAAVIVLLDINMPRMNGLEMLEEVRKDPDILGSIVFVLTTSQAEGDVFEAYNKNVAGYIIKSHLNSGFDGLFDFLDRYIESVELPIFSGK